ncbi:MAG: RNA-binding S4 domain-containing protein [Bacteroidales bacterium]|jgi:ribosome-associated heat shock protein Hsp15|nr:RNA-binding S4 domain-containing protein [Bacteroidales bacterium]
MENIRIDKFLWAVRLYKTRTLAADACRLGKIKCGDLSVKASKEVKIGDIYTIKLANDNVLTHKIIKVKNLLNGRVAAKLVSEFIEDLTPQEDYEKQKIARMSVFEKRDRGTGRPSKKDRRDIEKLKF